MSNRKGTKKLKITFINPNSKKDFEELIKLVIIERIKRSSNYPLGSVNCTDFPA